MTHYGVSYTDLPLGCGVGYYSPDNPTIIAVGYEREWDWPCRTLLEVCGAAGCIVGWRQDTCPGCLGNHLDLSEAGINRVCGDQADICDVTIQMLSIEVPPQEPRVTQVFEFPLTGADY